MAFGILKQMELSRGLSEVLNSGKTAKYTTDLFRCARKLLKMKISLFFRLGVIMSFV